jgi:hypothetical protein
MRVSTPNGVPRALSPSFVYIKQELKRIPITVRVRLNQLGLGDDLEQELHLAFYEKTAARATSAEVKRAIHAAGERLRYREIVRKAKYELPEDLAGHKYQLFMYGEDPNNSINEY